jgi:hypothetical protein
MIASVAVIWINRFNKDHPAGQARIAWGTGWIIAQAEKQSVVSLPA